MQVVLFQPPNYADFLPFTWTTAVYDLRCGILTPRERYTRLVGYPVHTYAGGDLQAISGSVLPAGDCLFVNAALYMQPSLYRAMQSIPLGTRMVHENGDLLGFKLTSEELTEALKGAPVSADFVSSLGPIYWNDEPQPMLRNVTDLFRLNGDWIRRDFETLTRGRVSAPLTDPYTRVYRAENVFLEAGAKVRAAILNAEEGPIYLGTGAEVLEGAMIHGAHALCAHSTVNMGAKLKGDSTIGPWCKVGGEVSNSVLMGYSNKGHDGFLGNSVLGYWCNLGADTNTSNLKNNYGPVRIFSPALGRNVDTGLQFCGLLMGDHCRAGINTMFNTGTVVGPWSSVFGGGFPPKYIPPFSWGGPEGFTTQDTAKAYEASQRMMARRHESLPEGTEALMQAVLQATESQRSHYSLPNLKNMDA
jgi:UDP-N-acetylglucosamine diphosphorylase/glucosamine-1-phosphate N-acetyltransferase